MRKTPECSISHDTQNTEIVLLRLLYIGDVQICFLSVKLTGSGYRFMKNRQCQHPFAHFYPEPCLCCIQRQIKNMGKPNFDPSTTEHQHSSIIRYRPSSYSGTMDEPEVPSERQKSSPFHASSTANNTFKIYGLMILQSNDHCAILAM